MKKSQKLRKNEKAKRMKHGKEEKAKALKYYLLGLTLPEISLLTSNTPVRTLERWQTLGKWTELRNPVNIKDKVLQLHDSGKRIEDIAEIVNRSHSTVYRWVKAARQNEGNTPNK